MSKDEKIEKLRVALIRIKRESRKNKPDPDFIYTWAADALEETE